MTLAVFDDYPSVQQAVDHLADHGFPVDRVSIVGRDLRYVEQVTGRMTVATAAVLGALQGASLGALFALAFGLIFTFSPDPALPLLVVYGIVAGAALGALFGALGHAAGAAAATSRRCRRWSPTTTRWSSARTSPTAPLCCCATSACPSPARPPTGTTDGASRPASA